MKSLFKKSAVIICIVTAIVLMTISASALSGDFDGNGQVNANDAIYLLMHTFFADDYPISGNADVDKSGVVNANDAIYVLMHTFFPEDYPLGCRHVYENGSCTVCGEKQPTPNSYFTFTKLDDGTYSIKAKYKGQIPDELVIPSQYNGKAVTIIADHAFESCTHLLSAVIPDSITNVGNGAFFQCEKLQSIVIPNNVTSIGDGTFMNCHSLKSITIPTNVANIGDANPFRGCHSLESITVDKNNQYFYSQNNCLIQTSDKALIAGCKNSVIPDDIQIIDQNAFWACRDLTSVTIPASVKIIEDFAFNYCDNLTSVTINGGSTDIDSDVFSYCDKLVFNVYDNAKYLGNTENPYMHLYSAVNQKITSVNIHSDTKSIAGAAFAGCNKLTGVTVPEGVIRISWCAFDSCTSLTSVIIPDSVTYIERGAFYNCTSLASIKLPNNLSRINTYTFESCYDLESITIPLSVTSIGDGAFYYCSALKNVYYTGSEEQWQNISIGEQNNKLKYAAIHYNSVIN